MNVFIFLTFFFAFCGSAVSQNDGSWFIEPEFGIGRNVRNFSKFPDSGNRTFYSLAVGRTHTDSASHWQGYYNFPTLSLNLFYSDLGSEVLGKELGIIPTITYNLSKRKVKSFYFKLGLGLSYATNPFDSLANPGNEILGAHWNWIFQLYLYHTLLHTERWHLKVGAGGLHSSNSHTQLPNFGLNSGIISFSVQHFLEPMRTQDLRAFQFQPDRKRTYFMQFVPGLGTHELGGTRRPLGGPDKIIPSFSAIAGIIFRRHLKVKTGLAWRYYDSYRDAIVKNEDAEFLDQPVWNATHLYVVIGAEYLVGHVGLDLESGITFHKPYFDRWFRDNESDDGFALWQHKTFPTRIGGNFYLINTNKNPTNNLFLGLHVNANWGTADFMGYTLGFVKRWKG